MDAGRALVEEHTPIEMLEPAEASRLLSEPINRPGMIWDGATGSGMNWRLALSELEAERGHLRLDGEPVILYSLLSSPRPESVLRLFKRCFHEDRLLACLVGNVWSTREPPHVQPVPCPDLGQETSHYQLRSGTRLPHPLHQARTILSRYHRTIIASAK